MAWAEKGDHINMQGPTVPPDLRDKWFIVESVEFDGTVRLSHPFYDKDCHVPYHPDPKIGRSRES